MLLIVCLPKALSHLCAVFLETSASTPPPPASDSTLATTCQHFSEFLKFVGNVVSSSTRRGLGVLTILGGVYTAKVNIPLLALLILYGIGLLTEAQELGIICPPRNRDEAIERTTWNPRNVRASKLRGKIDRGTSRPSKLFARVVFNATGYLSCVALYALYAGLTGASNSIEPTSVWTTHGAFHIPTITHVLIAPQRPLGTPLIFKKPSRLTTWSTSPTQLSPWPPLRSFSQGLCSPALLLGRPLSHLATARNLTLGVLGGKTSARGPSATRWCKSWTNICRGTYHSPRDSSCHYTNGGPNTGSLGALRRPM